MLQKLRSHLRNAVAVQGLYGIAARISDDPWAHPALKAMSARELADIPLPQMPHAAAVRRSVNG